MHWKPRIDVYWYRYLWTDRLDWSCTDSKVPTLSSWLKKGKSRSTIRDTKSTKKSKSRSTSTMRNKKNFRIKTWLIYLKALSTSLRILMQRKAKERKMKNLKLTAYTQRRKRRISAASTGLYTILKRTKDFCQCSFTKRMTTRLVSASFSLNWDQSSSSSFRNISQNTVSKLPSTIYTKLSTWNWSESFSRIILNIHRLHTELFKKKLFRSKT